MNIFTSLKDHFGLWVWRHTPHCREIVRLASQSLEQPLPIRTRLKIRLHFIVCVWCHRYVTHLKFLHRAGHQAGDHLETMPSRGLSAEARERIVKRLKVAEHENL
jgi:hypothetical protein